MSWKMCSNIVTEISFQLYFFCLNPIFSPAQSHLNDRPIGIYVIHTVFTSIYEWGPKSIGEYPIPCVLLWINVHACDKIIN